MRRVLIAALGVVVSACAATPADDSASRQPDAVEIEASPATRAEVGVALWSVAKNADGNIMGYDADNGVVVELAHATKVEDGRTLDAFTLEQDGDSSHVVLLFQPDGAVTVLDSSVSKKHERIAELLSQDLKSQPDQGNGFSLATASLGGPLAEKLMPLSPLVNETCVDLVKDCNLALITNGLADADIITYCKSDSEIRHICEPSYDSENVGPYQDCTLGYPQRCNDATRAKKESQATAQKCQSDSDYKNCSNQINGRE